MLWCYYLGQVWPLRCYYLGQVCFLQNTVCQKHYKIGFQHLFFAKQNCTRKFEVLLSGPSWPFLSCNQFGPDNNTYLAQVITPQNVYFCLFCFKKCAEIPIFIVFVEHQPKLAKNGQKINDNFSHFAKHRFIKKKNFLLQPPFSPKIGVFQL